MIFLWVRAVTKPETPQPQAILLPITSWFSNKIVIPDLFFSFSLCVFNINGLFFVFRSRSNISTKKWSILVLPEHFQRGTCPTVSAATAAAVQTSSTTSRGGINAHTHAPFSPTPLCRQQPNSTCPSVSPRNNMSPTNPTNNNAPWNSECEFKKWLHINWARFGRLAALRLREWLGCERRNAREGVTEGFDCTATVYFPLGKKWRETIL